MINWTITILFIILYVLLQVVFFELILLLPSISPYLMDGHSPNIWGKLLFTSLYVFGIDILIMKSDVFTFEVTA